MNRTIFIVFSFFVGGLFLLSGINAKLSNKILYSARSLDKDVYRISPDENILVGILFVCYGIYVCFLKEK